MAKKKNKKCQRSAQGDILARQAWEAKAQADAVAATAPGRPACADRRATPRPRPAARLPGKVAW